MLVERAAVGEEVDAPGFVADGVPIHDLAAAFVEDAEDFDIPCHQLDGFLTTIGAQFGGDDAEIVHLEGLLIRR